MRYIIVLLSIIYLSEYQPTNSFHYTNTYNPESLDVISLGPPNYQLYDYMKIYSKKYNIPFDYALRCAKEETGYEGKFHFTYRPFEDRLRVSPSFAYGPLQVKLPTANDMWGGRTITAAELSYDIKLNVITSFRYKRYLYNIFKDWLKVYSIYNKGWHGKNDINSYAVNIVTGNSEIIF